MRTIHQILEVEMEQDLRAKLAKASAGYATALREFQKIKQPTTDDLKRIIVAKKHLMDVKNEYLKKHEKR